MLTFYYRCGHHRSGSDDDDPATDSRLAALVARGKAYREAYEAAGNSKAKPFIDWNAPPWGGDGLARLQVRSQ